jgi:predicted DNA-binding protein
MTESKKTMVVSIRLTEEAYKGLETLAKADRRKLATYLSLVLEDHLAGRQGEAVETKPKTRKQ